MIAELAFDGRLDFSRLDPFSRSHAMLLTIFHNLAVSRDSTDRLKFLQQRALSKAGQLTLPADSRKRYDQEELSLSMQLLDIQPISQAERDRQVAAEARQSWESQYGRLDDPEVQAAIDRTAAALMQR